MKWMCKYSLTAILNKLTQGHHRCKIRVGGSQSPGIGTLGQIRYQRSLWPLSTRPSWFPCLAMNMKSYGFNNRSIFLEEWATDRLQAQKNHEGKMCDFLKVGGKTPISEKWGGGIAPYFNRV